MKILGILIMIWAVCFSITMTNHFGGNWLPETTEELMCDITSIIILIFGNMVARHKKQ